MGDAITSVSPARPGSARLYIWLGALAVFALTAVTFVRTLDHALLQWDDQYHLTSNPFLQPDSPDRYGHFWREPYGKLYVPITYNVWAWIYGRSFDSTGKLSPWLLHAANVLVHALTSAIAFFLLRRLLYRFDLKQRVNSAAIIGALVFALHPLQVESVAWISELRGLLAGMFGLAAALVYFDGRGGKGTVALRIAASTALLALGLLCKPSVAALPLVWLAMDALGSVRRWSAITLSLVLPVAFVVASIGMMRFLQPGPTVDAGAIWERPLIAGDAIAFYLGKLVWPFGLCADYSRTPEIVRASSGFWILWIVPLAVAGLIGWRATRRDATAWRVGLLAFAIFVAALTPVLGLVPFDFQRLSTVADRYAYLALLGPAFLVAYAASRDDRMLGGGIVLVALLGWRTIDQQRHWKDDASLWQHAANVHPGAIVATSNLAAQAAERGDRVTADRLYRRVIETAPRRGNGYRGLARLAADAGDITAALGHYEAAVLADQTDALARDGAGQMYQALGDLDRAKERFESAVRVDPEFADGWNNLGAFYLRQSNADLALPCFARSAAIHPRHPTAWFNLALAHDAVGNASDVPARQALAQGERVTGGPNAAIRRMLGVAALRASRFAAAEDWFRLAIDANPVDVASINDLGQTLAALGRVDEAIRAFEQAIALRPDLVALRENLESAKRLKAINPPPPP